MREDTSGCRSCWRVRHRRRLSLPYHDAHATDSPRRLHRQLEHRADGAGEPAGGARRAASDSVALRSKFERIGILGTSLGSCLSLLTAHEPKIRVQALNHVSPWFADVVWRGLSTPRPRRTERSHQLEQLRRLWRCQPDRLPRSGARQAHVARLRKRPDLPVDLSRRLVDEFASRGLPHQVAVLPAAITAAERLRSSSSTGMC